MSRPQGPGDLCAALVATRPETGVAFREALRERGFRVESFAGPWELLQAARATAWNLVLLEGPTRTLREPIERLMEIDAGQTVAVITEEPPEDFHGAMEGLGLLGPLPSRPSGGEVEALLGTLRSLGAVDPKVEAAQARLDAMSREHHPHCVVCWEQHPFGLKVDYRVTAEHRVEGRFACGPFYEGYARVVHGGIVSALLDGAMASCILAKGLEAYTVELKVRFRTAVETGAPATIRGEWVRSEGPIHLLHATLEQGGQLRASARAKFFEGTPNQPSRPLPGGAGLRDLLDQARKRLR